MFMKNNVTIKVDASTVEKMRKYYVNYVHPNNGEYVDFEARINDVIVTAFITKKDRKKVYFLGEHALEEAQKWDPEATLNEKLEQLKMEWICFEDQAGSDEVGVGDFLGPMIVVAAFVSEKDISRLKELGIQDSKKMNDKQIMEVGPIITREFSFSKLTLPNSKYNELVDRGENLNSMKAKMHNRALLNVLKDHPTSNVFIDQFVAPKTYYSYLNDANEPQVKNIVFKTKGESWFPCVALASVIARYSYLLEMEKLNKQYGLVFPFGASNAVNTFAKKFVKKYGEKELYKIAKKNFANYNEVLEK